jgi:DAK2 domain fusion protein YloV
VEVVERLEPEHLRSVVLAYRDALRAHQERLNRLNVYPVPDGDTGTNMALTLEAVAAELAEVGEEDDMPGLCRAISHGSLMGARGNSGVILSQVLRGLSERLRGDPAVEAKGLAEALAAASEAAYQAVMRPVEGTILTVARVAAEAAQEAAAEPNASLVSVLERSAAAAEDALERTPELLPVLAEAGVVDAGGAGFVLLLDVLLHVAAGRPVPEPELVAAAVPQRSRAGAADHNPADGEEGSSDLRYEVMFFLEAPDESLSAFKETWATVGDSIVVVGGDGLWNCHIHTDDIGAAIEAAIEAGRPRNIRVTDLAEQVEEERWVRQELSRETTPGRCTGVVAVAAGKGAVDILRSLGVATVVAGGQSMNPSTAELVQAIEATAAEGVVLLPNNKNVIPVAERAAPLASKPVRVVPTASLAEGFAAVVGYDPDADPAANAEAMAKSAEQVVWGEVTWAVRDASTPAGPVRQGEHMGLLGYDIVAVAPDLAEAASSLLDRLVEPEHELVTVVTGEAATEEATRRITEWLEANRPEAAVEVLEGGQPLSAYLFSAE